jgi:hypothetical protein
MKKIMRYAIPIAVVVIIILALVITLPDLDGSGELRLHNYTQNTSVYIDGQPVSPSSVRGSTAYYRTEEGPRSILASREGYWPWNKEVEVQNTSPSEISPFFVEINPQSYLVSRDDDEYKKIASEIEKDQVPTKDNPVLSSDGKMAAWKLNNSVIIEWKGSDRNLPSYFCNIDGCLEQLNILTIQSDIKDLDFYKDRHDVLVFAVENGIHAIEVDMRSTQNFQPIYSGKDPYFSKSDADTLFVYDDGVIVRLDI